MNVNAVFSCVFIDVETILCYLPRFSMSLDKAGDYNYLLFLIILSLSHCVIVCEDKIAL